MFEKYLEPLIMSYLSSFIANLPQLKLSFWAGEVVLRNLEIRHDLAGNAALQLPFLVVGGHIKELHLHIPWTTLTSQPVKITLRNVELLIDFNGSPNSAQENASADPHAVATVSLERASEADLDSDELESDSIDYEEDEEEGNGGQSWTASLANKIKNNVEIKVDNLVVRYNKEPTWEAAFMLGSVYMYSVDSQFINKEFVDPGDYLYMRKFVRVEDITFRIDKKDESASSVPTKPVASRLSASIRMESIGNIRDLSLGDDDPTAKIDVRLLDTDFTLDSEQYSHLMDLINYFTGGGASSDSSTAASMKKSPAPKSPRATPPRKKPQVTPNKSQGWVSWIMGGEAPVEDSHEEENLLMEPLEPIAHLTRLGIFVQKLNLSLVDETCTQMASFHLAGLGLELITDPLTLGTETHVGVDSVYAYQYPDRSLFFCSTVSLDADPVKSRTADKVSEGWAFETVASESGAGTRNIGIDASMRTFIPDSLFDPNAHLLVHFITLNSGGTLSPARRPAAAELRPKCAGRSLPNLLPEYAFARPSKWDQFDGLYLHTGIYGHKSRSQLGLYSSAQMGVEGTAKEASGFSHSQLAVALNCVTMIFSKEKLHPLLRFLNVVDWDAASPLIDKYADFDPHAQLGDILDKLLWRLWKVAPKETDVRMRRLKCVMQVPQAPQLSLLTGNIHITDNFSGVSFPDDAFVSELRNYRRNQSGTPISVRRKPTTQLVGYLCQTWVVNISNIQTDFLSIPGNTRVTFANSRAPRLFPYSDLSVRITGSFETSVSAPRLLYLHYILKIIDLDSPLLWSESLPLHLLSNHDDVAQILVLGSELEAVLGDHSFAVAADRLHVNDVLSVEERFEFRTRTTPPPAATTLRKFFALSPVFKVKLCGARMRMDEHLLVGILYEPLFVTGEQPQEESADLVNKNSSSPSTMLLQLIDQVYDVELEDAVITVGPGVSICAKGKTTFSTAPQAGTLALVLSQLNMNDNIFGPEGISVSVCAEKTLDENLNLDVLGEMIQLMLLEEHLNAIQAAINRWSYLLSPHRGAEHLDCCWRRYAEPLQLVTNEPISLRKAKYYVPPDPVEPLTPAPPPEPLPLQYSGSIGGCQAKFNGNDVSVSLRIGQVAASHSGFETHQVVLRATPEASQLSIQFDVETLSLTVNDDETLVAQAANIQMSSELDEVKTHIIAPFNVRGWRELQHKSQIQVAIAPVKVMLTPQVIASIQQLSKAIPSRDSEPAPLQPNLDELQRPTSSSPPVSVKLELFSLEIPYCALEIHNISFSKAINGDTHAKLESMMLVSEGEQLIKCEIPFLDAAVENGVAFCQIGSIDVGLRVPMIRSILTLTNSMPGSVAAPSTDAYHLPSSVFSPYTSVKIVCGSVSLGILEYSLGYEQLFLQWADQRGTVSVAGLGVTNLVSPLSFLAHLETSDSMASVALDCAEDIIIGATAADINAITSLVSEMFAGLPPAQSAPARQLAVPCRLFETNRNCLKDLRAGSRESTLMTGELVIHEEELSVAWRLETPCAIRRIYQVEPVLIPTRSIARIFIQYWDFASQSYVTTGSLTCSGLNDSLQQCAFPIHAELSTPGVHGMVTPETLALTPFELKWRLVSSSTVISARDLTTKFRVDMVENLILGQTRVSVALSRVTASMLHPVEKSPMISVCAADSRVCARSAQLDVVSKLSLDVIRFDTLLQCSVVEPCDVRLSISGSATDVNVGEVVLNVDVPTAQVLQAAASLTGDPTVFSAYLISNKTCEAFSVAQEATAEEDDPLVILPGETLAYSIAFPESPRVVSVWMEGDEECNGRILLDSPGEKLLLGDKCKIHIFSDNGHIELLGSFAFTNCQSFPVSLAIKSIGGLNLEIPGNTESLGIVISDSQLGDSVARLDDYRFPLGVGTWRQMCLLNETWTYVMVSGLRMFFTPLFTLRNTLPVGLQVQHSESILSLQGGADLLISVDPSSSSVGFALDSALMSRPGVWSSHIEISETLLDDVVQEGRTKSLPVSLGGGLAVSLVVAKDASGSCGAIGAIHAPLVIVNKCSHTSLDTSAGAQFITVPSGCCAPVDWGVVPASFNIRLGNDHSEWTSVPVVPRNSAPLVLKSHHGLMHCFHVEFKEQRSSLSLTMLIVEISPQHTLHNYLDVPFHYRIAGRKPQKLDPRASAELNGFQPGHLNVLISCEGEDHWSSPSLGVVAEKQRIPVRFPSLLKSPLWGYSVFPEPSGASSSMKHTIVFPFDFPPYVFCNQSTFDLELCTPLQEDIQYLQSGASLRSLFDVAVSTLRVRKRGETSWSAPFNLAEEGPVPVFDQLHLLVESQRGAKLLTFSAAPVEADGINAIRDPSSLRVRVEAVSLRYFEPRSPLESVRLTVDNIDLSMVDRDNDTSPFSRHRLLTDVSLSVQSLQLDDMSPVCEFPVVVVPKATINKPTDGGYKSLLQVRALYAPNYIDDCSVSVQPLVLYVAEDFIMYAMDQLAIFNSIAEFDEDDSSKGELEALLLSESVVPPYWEHLKLDTTRLQVTLRYNVPKVHFHLGMDGSPLVFSAVEMSHVTSWPAALTPAITSAYLADALVRTPALLGSLQLLGNPTSFIGNIVAGVYDLFAMPLKGVRQMNPLAAILGIGRGSASFIRHLGLGTLESFTGWSTAVSKNIDALSLDESFVKQQMQRRGSAQRFTAVSGVGSGLLSFASSLYDGVSGVVASPYKGAQSGGVVGLFTGLGVGVIGVVTKPVGGLVELVSRASQGVLNSAGGGPFSKKRTTDRAVRAGVHNSQLKWKMRFGGCQCFQATYMSLGDVSWQPCTLVVTESHRLILISVDGCIEWSGDIKVQLVKLAEDYEAQLPVIKMDVRGLGDAGKGKEEEQSHVFEGNHSWTFQLDDKRDRLRFMKCFRI